MAEPVMVHPAPGRTIYLPGGTHGFAKGPVPMHPDHAAALLDAGHVVTHEQYLASRAKKPRAKGKAGA
jgi:hypothetical protein